MLSFFKHHQNFEQLWSKSLEKLNQSQKNHKSCFKMELLFFSHAKKSANFWCKMMMSAELKGCVLWFIYFWITFDQTQTFIIQIKLKNISRNLPLFHKYKFSQFHLVNSSLLFNFWNSHFFFLRFLRGFFWVLVFIRKSFFAWPSIILM